MYHAAECQFMFKIVLAQEVRLPHVTHSQANSCLAMINSEPIALIKINLTFNTRSCCFGVCSFDPHSRLNCPDLPSQLKTCVWPEETDYEKPGQNGKTSYLLAMTRQQNQNKFSQCFKCCFTVGKYITYAFTCYISFCNWCIWSVWK